MESKLRSGNNPNVSFNLVNYVVKLNDNIKRLVKRLINFKKRVLDGVLPCNLFTSNYLLLDEHVLHEADYVLREANYYIRLL